MDGHVILRRAYRYRIYPTARQRLALEAQLRFACELYNAALEQRRDAWRSQRRALNYVTQCRELTDVRAAGLGPVQMNCTAMRDPLRRLDRAFAAFFRRVKARTKPGYPRFRASRRYDSLTWADGWAIVDGRLAVQGVGHVKANWHRPLPPSARVCTITIRRVAGRWNACFSLTLATTERVAPSARPAVGIDLGINHFAALSTGEQIAGPRAYRAALGRLRLVERRLARRRKGSHRRQKLGLLLARQQERIRNVRRDHAHQLSRRLVREFGMISTERLNIRALASGFLAREIRDQAWAAFLKVLEYKAEEAGTQLIKVSPKGTSQDCSSCGTRVPKGLSDRIHKCLSCHLVVDRDTNAARNILRLGLSLQASTWPRGRALPEKAYSISSMPLHLTLGMHPTTIDMTNRPFHVLKESK